MYTTVQAHHITGNQQSPKSQKWKVGFIPTVIFSGSKYFFPAVFFTRPAVNFECLLSA